MFHKNVALHATMVCDITIAHDNLQQEVYMSTLYFEANAIWGTEDLKCIVIPKSFYKSHPGEHKTPTNPTVAGKIVPLSIDIFESKQMEV